MEFEKWNTKRLDLSKKISSEINLIKNKIKEIHLISDSKFRAEYIEKLSKLYLELTDSRITLSNYNINKYFGQFFEEKTIMAQEIEKYENYYEDDFNNKYLIELKSSTINQIIALHKPKENLERMYISWILSKHFKLRYTENIEIIEENIKSILSKGSDNIRLLGILKTYLRNINQTQESLISRQHLRMPIVPELKLNDKVEVSPKNKTNLFKLISWIFAYNQNGLVFNLENKEIMDLLSIKNENTIFDLISSLKKLNNIIHLKRENKNEFVITNVIDIMGINIDFQNRFSYIPDLKNLNNLNERKIKSIELMSSLGSVILGMFLEERALNDQLYLNSDWFTNIINVDKRLILYEFNKLSPDGDINAYNYIEHEKKGSNHKYSLTENALRIFQKLIF